MSKRPNQDFWADVHSLWVSVENLNGRVLSWTEKAFTWKEDALQPEHLCDNLIGLIGPDVHLEGGGRLKEFPHSR